MNPNFSKYQLHAKIDAMSKFLNLDKYIDGEKNSLEQIRSYFKVNDWAYRHFHSQDGFMHFRISSSGCFTDEDVYYQPDLKRLERKAAKILERPTLSRLMFWLLPDQFVTNIILGYLGYDFGNAGIGSYQEWVLRKP